MAQAKLTLSLDSSTIEFGKKYVQDNHTSLSKLVQDFLEGIAKKEAKKKVEIQLNEYPEWIQQLVVAKEPTPDFDHKAEYHKHLEEKYGL
jgi:hypothetical protein